MRIDNTNRVMKICIYLFILISTPIIAYSQVDSSYIGFYSHDLSVKGYTSQNFLNLTQDVNGKEVTYKSNNPVGIGFGFSWKNTVISFSYAYPFDLLRNKSKGKTKTDLDFQFHNYSRKFVFDIYLQKYKGFYKEYDDTEDFIEICPDLSIKQYSVYTQYILNGNKYSYKAAFAQNEKQLKSVGSFLIGGSIHITQIDSDSSFTHNDKQLHKNFQFGINGGYAYTWVINQNWFVNASSSIGINLGSESIQKFGKQTVKISPVVLPRFSAGYDKYDWSIGLKYVSSITFPSLSENSSIIVNNGNWEVTYTKRFNKIPFLSDKFK